MNRCIFISFLVFVAVVRTVPVALTPPWGLNTWDAFHYWVDEASVIENARSMYTLGLTALGWDYLVIDEGWYRFSNNSMPINAYGVAIDEYGRYLPTPDRFPSAGPFGKSGFKSLCDLQLKYGVTCGVHLISGIPMRAVYDKLPILGTPYTARDIATSAPRGSPPLNFGVNMTHPGSQAYYDSLVQLLASWGVRFIKFDFSFDAEEVRGVSLAINKTNLPIVLSVNGAGGVEYGNMWRIGDDVWDVWGDVYEHFGQLPSFVTLEHPGHWPDSDMLPLGRIGGLENVTSHYGSTCSVRELNCEVSNDPNYRYQECCPRQSRLTQDESQTLMSLWLIARSPLMFGGYLPQTEQATIALLTNPETLEVNLKGYSPNSISFIDKDYAIWQSLHEGGVYVGLFNLRDVEAQALSVKFSALKIRGNTCKVRNLWARKEIGTFTFQYLSETLSPHASELISIYGCV
eukprot:TRINITY_DN1303_c0_g2_i2.p1 TRINITY_DN1303_c0_g2~~TRINITY_DN1303_c0_g2_i2.p1  ORF type:complete len:459 (+),score=42.99 TRINITY_DN1303_c0_g2_i2:28-1404(+)